jgi:predicted ATPase
MFRRILLRNFKGFGSEGQEIAFAPFTIFVGENGTGKSTILQAIDGIRHMAGTEGLSSLHFFGDNGKYQSLHEQRSFFFRNNPFLEVDIRVEMAFEDSGGMQDLKYAVLQQPSADRLEQAFCSKGLRAWTRDVLREEASSQRERSLHYSFAPERRFLAHSNLPFSESAIRWSDETTPGQHPARMSQEESEEFNRNSASLVEAFRKARSALVNNVWLLREHRDLSRRREGNDPEPHWVGPYGENALRRLAYLYTKLEYKKNLERIAFWAGKLGLPNITAGVGLDGGVSAQFGETADVGLPLTFAGSGPKQALPYIVQMFSPERFGALLIEEPEISMHPEIQLLVPEAIADCISMGKQVIATTHSTYFPFGALNLVRKGNLKREDLAIYQFEKTEAGNVATRVEIEDPGYVKGWIKTFAKVETRLFDEWYQDLGEADN